MGVGGAVTHFPMIGERVACVQAPLQISQLHLHTLYPQKLIEQVDSRGPWFGVCSKKLESIFRFDSQFLGEKKMDVDGRADGRKLNQLRPLTCSRNLLNRAHGSARWSQAQVVGQRIGGTIVLAAVYGPKSGTKKGENPEKASIEGRDRVFGRLGVAAESLCRRIWLWVWRRINNEISSEGPSKRDQRGEGCRHEQQITRRR
ncbi:hypothetical protein KSP40_PGU009236 [Platanthera guangdongensis]|uniref:Uncharacterized protein n=1 Tax=Platanthera guangdongensis TaxID=2320717 RepID=A0ABR2MT62_9ASPA